jgi:hypothetical protein
MRAFSTAFVKLPVDVILDVLGIVACVFYLYETTLRYAVGTPTRRCKDTFRNDGSINDVGTSSVLYDMVVPVEITR